MTQQVVDTHGFLVFGHHSDKGAPALRVLPQQIEADLLDTAGVWNLVVHVGDGRRGRAGWPTAADRRIKPLTAENSNVTDTSNKHQRYLLERSYT